MTTGPALTIYKILLGLIVILSLIFLGGTAYWFFSHRFNQEVSETHGIAPLDEQIFTGIGRLRLNTAEPQSAMVILTITFPYSPGDRAFAEELAARIRDFRTITSNYFLSINTADLLIKNEEEVKFELLEEFNSILRLGSIQILYFNDFLILD